MGFVGFMTNEECGGGFGGFSVSMTEREIEIINQSNDDRRKGRGRRTFRSCVRATVQLSSVFVLFSATQHTTLKSLFHTSMFT